MNQLSESSKSEKDKKNLAMILLFALGFLFLIISIVVLAYIFIPSKTSNNVIKKELPSKSATEIPPMPIKKNNIQPRNTQPTIGFNYKHTSLVEHADSVGITIKLSEKTSKDVTFSYSIIDGTATKGVDYNVYNSNPITIPAGQQYGYITMKAILDKTVEPEESFIIKLYNPTNANLTKQEYSISPGVLGYQTKIIINDN